MTYSQRVSRNRQRSSSLMRFSATAVLAIALPAALVLAMASPSLAGPTVPDQAQACPTGFWANVAWLHRRVKLKCQTSNAGKLLTNAVRPISRLTGGIIPVPNDNHFAGAIELNATKPAGTAPGAVPKPPPPPPPAVAAAATVKAEKQQAEIRREAVAYLAGLDCRYYPEAETALIASLRADRAECVRLEAAKSLLAGCCCTPATTKALTISVAGTCEDGNPAERSPAVRQVALAALQKCQRCGMGSPLTPPEAPLGTVPLEQGPTLAAFSEPQPQTSTPAAATDLSNNSTASSQERKPTTIIDLWRASAE